jgi:dUTP diphosphatase
VINTDKSNQSRRVKILRLAHGEGLPLPAYQTDQASGVDLYAAIDVDDPVILVPGARSLVPTGICLEMPALMEAQVRPRSGLAAKFGVTVLNTPGTIDADYRGELQVILINLAGDSFQIDRGMRIAQLVFQPVLQVALSEVEILSTTQRGSGGFGSSGGLDRKNT